MKSPHKGIKRIFKAFGYSFDGFKAAFKNEAAFRQDVFFCTIGFIALIFIPVTYLEKILMASALLLILLMELVNTGIEAIIDHISPNYHELSKIAKDVGSLLVLISFINWLIIWGTLLVKNFITLAKS